MNLVLAEPRLQESPLGLVEERVGVLGLLGDERRADEFGVVDLAVAAEELDAIRRELVVAVPDNRPAVENRHRVHRVGCQRVADALHVRPPQFDVMPSADDPFERVFSRCRPR